MTQCKYVYTYIYMYVNHNHLQNWNDPCCYSAAVLSDCYSEAILANSVFKKHMNAKMTTDDTDYNWGIKP